MTIKNDQKHQQAGISGLLSLIYYQLVGNISIKSLYKQKYRQIPLKQIDIWYRKMEACLVQHLGGDVVQKLRNAPQPTEILPGEEICPEEEVLFLRLAAGNALPNRDQIIHRIASSWEYGTRFLYRLNLEYNIISGRAPGEHDNLNQYQALSLIAAHKKYQALKPGEYILTNCQFQEYSISLCKEKKDLYRFEIRSSCSSLENTRIGLYLKDTDEKIQNIEQECRIITDTYILYYQGDLTQETEIVPYVWPMNKE